VLAAPRSEPLRVPRKDLFAEDVPLARIAQEVGTPTYVYSTATLTRHYRVMSEAFESVPHLLCYAVKASSNLAILSLFAREGSGFDIVSEGELRRVQAAGGDPSKVVFAGVGKTKDEIAAALAARILMFNVESAEELELLDAVGRAVATPRRSRFGSTPTSTRRPTATSRPGCTPRSSECPSPRRASSTRRAG